MFETETRLQKCFASVFPGLTLEEIRGTGCGLGRDLGLSLYGDLGRGCSRRVWHRD